MDCQTTQDSLSRYVDGELPADLSRSLTAHLEACNKCGAEAVALRSMGDGVRELAEPAPVSMRARISHEARAAQARRDRQDPWIPRFSPAWSRAAAVLVGAASVAFALSPFASTPVPTPQSMPAARLLVSESQSDLELDGSFRGEFRFLARRPEGRLMHESTHDLTRGR